jgi:hypothetical protein
MSLLLMEDLQIWVFRRDSSFRPSFKKVTNCDLFPWDNSTIVFIIQNYSDLGQLGKPEPGIQIQVAKQRGRLPVWVAG